MSLTVPRNLATFLSKNAPILMKEKSVLTTGHEPVVLWINSRVKAIEKIQTIKNWIGYGLTFDWPITKLGTKQERIDTLILAVKHLTHRVEDFI